MKRILLTAAAGAAALAGPAAVAAPAMAAPAQAAVVSYPTVFRLAAACNQPAADYGRGIALGGWANGYRQITLSTRNKITLQWRDVRPPDERHDYGTMTLGYGSRYLRVDRTHAWLGTAKQVFSVYAGYGDACGGPRRVHLGEANGRPGPLEWTGEGRTLRAEDHRVTPISRVMHQVWAWTGGPA